MDCFQYREGALWTEEVAATTLAEQYGTPLYVYSQDTLLQHYERIHTAFAALDPMICYAVKSCSNIHICRLFAERGSGFDVVSGGELYRVLQAGADPARVVFAGVGKTEREIEEALAAGIGRFNAESVSELEQVNGIATRMGRAAHVDLRVNPDVDAKTHAYTTTGRKENKFGVAIEQAPSVFDRFRDSVGLKLRGIHLHIGSPVNDVQSYVASIERGLALIDTLRHGGHPIDTLDIGGGFGAFYEGHEAPSAQDYANVIVPLLRDRGLRIIMEPGRSITANAGLLLTRVLHVKQAGTRRFVIVDAAMTELIRPALYGAYHFVWPAVAAQHVPETRAAQQPFADLVASDVVGPVCESGDFLAKERGLPPGIEAGDLIAVFSAGAYAMAMASQYNSRPRPAEVLVDGQTSRVIRRRESYADLIATELDANAAVTSATAS